MTPAIARYTIAVAASPIRLRRARAFQFSQNHHGRVNVMRTRQTLVPIQRVRSEAIRQLRQGEKAADCDESDGERMRPLDQLPWLVGLGLILGSPRLDVHSTTATVRSPRLRSANAMAASFK